MGRFADRLAAIADHYQGGAQDPKARLVWQSVDNQIYELDKETLMVHTLQFTAERCAK